MDDNEEYVEEEIEVEEETEEEVERNKELCEGCGQCCSYVTIQIPEPEDADDWDELLWFVSHENMWVFIEDGDWFVEIFNKCMYLADDKTCKIYEKRPLVCREHGHEGCEKYGYGEAYDIVFKQPEELIRYMKEKNVCLEHPMLKD